MKKYLSNTALLLEAVGLVLMFTRDSWGANKPLYAFTGCALLFIGFSIMTYLEFPRPFHSVSRSKKIGVIIPHLPGCDTRYMACLRHLSDGAGTAC